MTIVSTYLTRFVMFNSSNGEIVPIVSDTTSGVALQQRYAPKYKSDVDRENKGNIKCLIFA